MSNEYQHDAIKELSRQEIFEFADRSLPKDRSDATAVYMASDNDRETHYLDRLGIPRERRVILESDPSLVDAVKKANPGIRVLPMSTTEFFEGEAHEYAPFWYCGLDYECMFNDSVKADLSHIARGNLLLDGGVIYTNVVGTREQKRHVKRYIHDLHMLAYHRRDKRLLREIFGETFDYNDQFMNALLSLPDEIREDNIDETLKGLAAVLKKSLFEQLLPENMERLRSYTVSERIKYELHNRKKIVYFSPIISVPGIEQVYDRISKEMPSVHVNELIKNLTKDSLIQILFEEVANEVTTVNEKFDVPHPGFMLGPLERIAIDYYKKGGLALVPHILQESDTQGYVIDSHKPLEYMSNRNTRMLLDLMRTRKINPGVRDIKERLIDNDFQIFITLKRPYMIRAKISLEDVEKYTRRKAIQMVEAESEFCTDLLEKKVGYLRHLDPLLSKSTPNRKNLGSAFKQPLTLALARKCVLNGMNDEEIEKQYQVKNWGRVRAVRANVTKGFIQKPKEKSKREPKETFEMPGSKYLVGRGVYRQLPETHRKRLDYFRDEVLGELSERRQATVRQAFHESNIRDVINPSIDPIRFYAFFDDVSLAISENKRITPDFIDDTYRSIRSGSLVDTVDLSTTSPVKRVKRKPPKKIPSAEIKEEVRGLVSEGFSLDDIWEEFGSHFNSRRQFGATVAWASQNLAKRRK